MSDEKQWTVSGVVSVRLKPKELEFLRRLDEHAPADQLFRGSKARGLGPAIHRLLEYAMRMEEVLAGPLRDHLSEHGLTPEEFAEGARVQARVVRGILAMHRIPDPRTVAKVKRAMRRKAMEGAN